MSWYFRFTFQRNFRCYWALLDVLVLGVKNELCYSWYLSNLTCPLYIFFVLLVYYHHDTRLRWIIIWCCLYYCYERTSKLKISSLHNRFCYLYLHYRSLYLLTKDYWVISVDILIKTTSFTRKWILFNEECGIFFSEESVLFAIVFLAWLLRYWWLSWLVSGRCLVRSISCPRFMLYRRKSWLWKVNSWKWNQWIDLHRRMSNHDDCFFWYRFLFCIGLFQHDSKRD